MYGEDAHMPSMGTKTETSRWREGKLNREFSHPNETQDHFLNGPQNP